MSEKNPPSTEVRLYKPSDSLAELCENIKNVTGLDIAIVDVFSRATRVNAVAKLLEHPEMENIISKLENNPAGFLTDMKDGRYPAHVRNQAVTQALSMGARITGNEFNVIKGRAMLVKNYYKRQLDIFGTPGSVTADSKYNIVWWDTENSEAVLNGSMATIPMVIRYKLVDKETGSVIEKEFARRIQVKAYSTDGPDMWVGKAERRIWMKFFSFLSGIDFGDEDEGLNGASGGANLPPATVDITKEKKTAPPPPVASEAVFEEVVGRREPRLEPAEPEPPSDFQKNDPRGPAAPKPLTGMPPAGELL